MLGKRSLRPGIHAVLAQAGGRCNEAHHAAFRAGAEQRALRPAQHFDPLQVEDLRKYGARQVDGIVAALQGSVVDVHAGRGGAAVRIDTPDRNPVADAIGALVAEVQAGRLRDDVVDIADVPLIEHLLRVGADADRNFAELARLFGGCNDDLYQARGLVGVSGSDVRLIRGVTRRHEEGPGHGQRHCEQADRQGGADSHGGTLH